MNNFSLLNFLDDQSHRRILHPFVIISPPPLLWLAEIQPLMKAPPTHMGKGGSIFKLYQFRQSLFDLCDVGLCVSFHKEIINDFFYSCLEFFVVRLWKTKYFCYILVIRRHSRFLCKGMFNYKNINNSLFSSFTYNIKFSIRNFLNIFLHTKHMYMKVYTYFIYIPFNMAEAIFSKNNKKIT